MNGVKLLHFNKDQLLEVAAYDTDIKLFQHFQGKLSQIQLLNGHTNCIFNQISQKIQIILYRNQDISILIGK
ncbi:unnamed protein product [Paramecium sonneborni]|uniref:Uncharacterized protein n=1 Tax=Paramecium sonneborni TaxID=65129 RepID=A0A8S1R9L5_9CILI|nr:unnamed protein product [Paramecium sonneborni]